MSSSAPQRHATVALICQRHDAQLRRVVSHRATTDASIVDQACQNAWAQLVNAVGDNLRDATSARPRTASRSRRIDRCALRAARAQLLAGPGTDLAKSATAFNPSTMTGPHRLSHDP